MKKFVRGFFAVGHIAVKKIVSFGRVRLSQVRFVFFTAKCPTAKNLRAEKIVSFYRSRRTIGNTRYCSLRAAIFSINYKLHSQNTRGSEKLQVMFFFLNCFFFFFLHFSLRLAVVQLAQHVLQFMFFRLIWNRKRTVCCNQQQFSSAIFFSQQQSAIFFFSEI